ncbi:hypothetical protein RCL_jg7366.t1 [Rhizophagus clarus]|uniref:Uncharacterized protein n=1 Tax=Rhizophagus clarus TaxID=94130 RepID=A0A8H3QI71_9GLOM|nr:hypothetical protein RCL_jg7366.t1 [Rhizophagus clarus]
MIVIICVKSIIIRLFDSKTKNLKNESLEEYQIRHSENDDEITVLVRTTEKILNNSDMQICDKFDVMIRSLPAVLLTVFLWHCEDLSYISLHWRNLSNKQTDHPIM